MPIKRTKKELEDSKACLTTYTGIKVHLYRPKPSEIDIRDIAKSLSCMPRYAGHTVKPYFVGDHSVLLTNIFLKRGYIELAKYALLHDASEAYYMDIPHPLKYMHEMAKYKFLEKQGQRIIYQRFGLAPEEPSDVKELDMLLVNNEKRDLMPNIKLNPQTIFYPDLTISPWGPEKTEREFLKMYNKLFGEKFGIQEIL